MTLENWDKRHCRSVVIDEGYLKEHNPLLLEEIRQRDWYKEPRAFIVDESPDLNWQYKMVCADPSTPKKFHSFILDIRFIKEYIEKTNKK